MKTGKRDGEGRERGGAGNEKRRDKDKEGAKGKPLSLF